jgi:hypothetical protein
LCGPRFFLEIVLMASYCIAVSSLRRPFFSDRCFFITVRLLRWRDQLTDAGLLLLTQAFSRMRTWHPFLPIDRALLASDERTRI